MTTAVRKKLIPANIYRDADKPRPQRKEMKVWDAEQSRRFMEAARSDRLWAMYVLDLSSGMRQGELFGLQWSDISFEAGTVAVRRQLNELRGQLWLAPPKSASGTRQNCHTAVMPGFTRDGRGKGRA